MPTPEGLIQFGAGMAAALLLWAVARAADEWGERKEK